MVAALFRKLPVAPLVLRRVARQALLSLSLAALPIIGLGVAAEAAEVGPPMLDINQQCDARTRHNATAMSECIVAESEARAELLQNWSRYSDGDVEKCVKLGRKAKRLPYSAMAKCLASDAKPEPAAHKPQ